MERSTRALVVPFLCVLTAFSTLAPEEALADFEVIAVPWVGNMPSVPHDVINGQWTRLKAVGRGGSCQTIQYEWDLNGDGVYDTNVLQSGDPYNLGYQHTYNEQS